MVPEHHHRGAHHPRRRAGDPDRSDPRARRGAPTITDDETIFTLLGGSYEVRSTEPLTDLCPASVCGDVAEPTTPAVLRSLARAVRRCWATSRLADERGEVDFGVAQDGSEDDGALEVSRSEAFDQSAARPWRHPRRGPRRAAPPAVGVPAVGATYAAPPRPGGRVPGWYDEGAADEARQRHLLQLQYADHLLGDAMERLRAESGYDDALVVVTADPGVASPTGSPCAGSPRATTTR